jgi:membrane protease YdiL (CAAX protease family)
MRIASAALATLLAAAFVLVQPVAGRRRYRRLVDVLPTDPGARLRHYRRGITGEWLAVGLVVLIGLLAHRHPAAIGLARGTHRGEAAGTVMAAAVMIVITGAVFRFGGPAIQEVLRRQARGFQCLLPRTRREKSVFVGLALTAGICEEILLRGFGIAYLRWVWPSAPNTAVIGITAAVFGLAHLYQGARGVVVTALMGMLLAAITLDTASLYPAMIIHALIDLRILALPDLDRPDATADPAAAPVSR